MTKITYIDKYPSTPCSLKDLKPGDYFIYPFTMQVGFVLIRGPYYQEKYPIQDGFIPVVFECNYTNVMKDAQVIKISEVEIKYKV